MKELIDILINKLKDEKEKFIDRVNKLALNRSR